MATVARFEIFFHQLIDEQGQLTQPIPDWATAEAIQHLYYIMVLTRAFDKKAISLQRTGKLGTYPPITGQEAISTAIGHAMHENDILVPYYRDYSAQIQRGVKMSELLAYWGGDERGNQFCDNLHDLAICVPIASQCLHAAGIGFAFQYRQEKRVVVVCLGEGGTSEGDFYEALNIAGTWKLPVVFVVNNNQWAISVPIAKQTASQTIAQKAIAAGFTGTQVDGNDVIGCRDVIYRAIEKARLGQGPSLVEAITYRLCDHTTADDATRYQPEHEVDNAQLKEPISRLRYFLKSLDLWNEHLEQFWVDKANQIVEHNVASYLERTPQSPNSMFDYHFAHLPNYLIEQRASALEYALDE